MTSNNNTVRSHAESWIERRVYVEPAQVPEDDEPSPRPPPKMTTKQREQSLAVRQKWAARNKLMTDKK